MKQIRNKTLFAIAATTALLVVGCTKELRTEQGGDATPGREVSVTLPMEVSSQPLTPLAALSKSSTRAASDAVEFEGFSVSFEQGEPATTATNAATAATESTATNATTNATTNAAGFVSPATRTIAQELTNVWVLQFDALGNNVKTANMGSLATGAFLIPELLTGTNQTICIVANGTALGLSITNPSTLVDFESKMLHTATVTDAAALPMAGKLTGVSVVDLGGGKGAIRQLGDASAAIILRRIQAEVTLTVDFAVTDYTLTDAQLYNVPVGATYGWKSSTTTFPDNAVAVNFGYTSTAAAGMTPVTSSTTGTKTTYKWFMGDNRRGEVAELTAQTGRNSTKAPTYATFARVTLTNNSFSYQKIYYDIYLGSGAVTNFDLVRNHTYTVTAAIKGSAAIQEAQIGIDARVSGEGFPIYLTDNKEHSPIAISLKSMESTATMIWGPTTSIPAAQGIYDGKANTDAIIVASATDYPAAKYCRDQGAEWYLPAQAQLMLMWIYLDAIPAADRPNASGTFWSSAEASDNTSYAWGVNFSSGHTYNDGKGLNYSVRCVREL